MYLNRKWQMGMLVLGGIVLIALPVFAAEWKEVINKSGSFKDTYEAGNGRRKARAPFATQGPVRFSVQGRAVRFKWTTETAGGNPDFFLEMERLRPLNNGRSKWQRYATFGRTHKSMNGAHAIECGPGNYRLYFKGHSMRYTVKVEALTK